MKLLIVTQTVDENDQLLGFFISWLRLFAEEFERVTVLCLNEGKHSLPENIRVICLGKNKGRSKLSQFLAFKFYVLKFRKEYDAVLVHMNPIWVVLGGPTWKLLRKKIYLWYTHKSVTSKLRLAEKFADEIFTASKESFRLHSSKVAITGHGIDTELFKPIQNSKGNQPAGGQKSLQLLSVGRIAPVKNYETLIDAVKILKNKDYKVSVTMIGEAPLERDKEYEKSLKIKIRNLKLEECFNFVGKKSHGELPEYYRTNDVFIHLSKTGSLDKTVLEAMASGMRVLSSNDSSRAFLPKELVFNEHDHIELSDKIISAMKIPADPMLREYVVKNHDLKNLVHKLSSRILNGRK